MAPGEGGPRRSRESRPARSSAPHPPGRRGWSAGGRCRTSAGGRGRAGRAGGGRASFGGWPRPAGRPRPPPHPPPHPERSAGGGRRCVRFARRGRPAAAGGSAGGTDGRRQSARQPAGEGRGGLSLSLGAGPLLGAGGAGWALRPSRGGAGPAEGTEAGGPGPGLAWGVRGRGRGGQRGALGGAGPAGRSRNAALGSSLLPKAFVCKRRSAPRALDGTPARSRPARPKVTPLRDWASAVLFFRGGYLGILAEPGGGEERLARS